MNRKIKILNEWYTTFYVELPDDTEYGLIKYKQKSIYIDCRLSLNEQKLTLAHEIAHAIAWNKGFNTDDESFVQQSSLIAIEYYDAINTIQEVEDERVLHK